MKVLPVIGIAAAAASAFAALYKFYLPVRVEQNLQQLIAQSEPYADLSYGKVTIGFNGQLQITHPSAKSKDGGAGLSAALVTMDFGDPVALTKALTGRLGRVPDKINIHLQETVLSGMDDDTLAALAGWPAACGTLPSSLQLGNSARPLELFASWRREASNDYWLSTDWGVPDAYRQSASVQLSGIQAETPALSKPRIGRLQFDYIDSGEINRATVLCADRAGVDQKTARRWLAEQHFAWLSQDGLWVPNEATHAALAQFFESPGSYSVISNGQAKLQAASFATFGPNQVLNTLDMTLHVNGEPVEGFGFDRAGRASTEPQAQGSTATGAPTSRHSRAIDRRPKAKIIDTLSYAELAQHTGFYVRLYTSDGEVHSGRVVTDVEAKPGIEQRYATGKWTFYPSAEHTQRIELIR